MEVLGVKVNRRGGGFTATVGITGPKTVRQLAYCTHPFIISQSCIYVRKKKKKGRYRCNMIIFKPLIKV
jgi:hypothetical protein